MSSEISNSQARDTRGQMMGPPPYMLSLVIATAVGLVSYRIAGEIGAVLGFLFGLSVMLCVGYVIEQLRGD